MEAVLGNLTRHPAPAVLTHVRRVGDLASGVPIRGLTARASEELVDGGGYVGVIKGPLQRQGDDSVEVVGDLDLRRSTRLLVQLEVGLLRQR